MLQEKLEALRLSTRKAIQEATSLDTLERVEFDVVGRKGTLTEAMKELKSVPVSEKPKVGQLINVIKKELQDLFELRRGELGGIESEDAGESIDITLPGKKIPQGHLHLITSAIEEIEAIFTRQGFTRVRYPEVEWDFFAFEALNMPKDHPARDEWETFFVTEKPIGDMGRILLTPHTSSGQVREMRKYSKQGEPIRMLNIAKCYRRQIDITHTPMFHQFEGLVVDRHVTITQLIGVLQYFVNEFFGADRKIRLRPYNFPFTEPSFEIDISCGICEGAGCSYCKEGWSELGGAGMVHAKVLEFGGYSPKEFTGFAFGFGVERTYMMKNNLNIPDVRLLYSNDLNFLEQF